MPEDQFWYSLTTKIQMIDGYRRHRQISKVTKRKIDNKPEWFPYGSEENAMLHGHLTKGAGTASLIDDSLSLRKSKAVELGIVDDELFPSDCKIFFDLQASSCGDVKMHVIFLPGENRVKSAFIDPMEQIMRISRTPLLMLSACFFSPFSFRRLKQRKTNKKK